MSKILRNKFIIKLLILFVIEIIIFVIFGITAFINQYDKLKKAKEAELLFISKIKAGQIEQWIMDKVTAASVITNIMALTDLSEARHKYEQDDQIKHLRKLCNAMLNNYRELQNIIIYDIKANVLYKAKHTDVADLSAFTERIIKSSGTESGVMISDIYLARHKNIPLLDIIAPIISAKNNKNTVEALAVFVINPAQHLYPLINTWPATSRTSETLLIKIEKDKISYLNETRHIRNPALSIWIPLTDNMLTEGLAASGRTGIVGGADYMGNNVIASIMPVKGTLWHIITKTDADEIFASMRVHLYLIVSIIIVINLFSILCIMILYFKQKKNYQKKLKISSDSINSLINASPMAIFNIDTNGSPKTIWNGAAEKIFGIRKEQILGRGHLLPSHNNLEMDNVIKMVIKGSALSKVEIKYNQPDGKVKNLSVSAVPISDNYCKSNEAIVIIEDLTERKTAELHLLEAEQKFNNVFENATVGIVLAGPDGDLLTINRRFIDMLGYAPAEINNINYTRLTHPDDVLRSREAVKRLLDGKDNKLHLNKRYLRKDGGIVWTDVNITLIKDTDGKPQYFIINVLDISEKKKQEEIIIAEKEKLLVTLRSIGDGVIVTRLNGDVILLNNVAENLTGWLNNEATGMHITEVMDLINEKTRLKIDNPFSRAVSTNSIISFDSTTLLISKDGTCRQIEDSCAPIHDKEKNIIGTVLVFRDVTEKRKLEESQINSQKLESLGLLAGGIAHDFNNLLSVIFGYYDLIKSDIGGENNKVDGYLNNIFDSYSRAKNLTKQLLTFAMGGVPQMETMNITNVLIKTAEFSLSGSNIKLILDIQEDLWPCDIDKNQIEQVIDNLVLNARQAMPAGGNITITAKNMGPEEKLPVILKPDRYIRISFRDTGMGISKEYIMKIFDPYFTTKTKGTGLGLSTAYSIIIKHDGFLDAESEHGKGSVFHLYLPASYKNEDSLFLKKEMQHEGIGSILVMDDESLILKFTSWIFRKMGYEVTCMTNSYETVREFKSAFKMKKPYKYVVLDLTIVGGMGGVDTLVALKKIDPAVVAVAASGYADDPVLAKPVEYGFKDSISKPYLIEDLHKLMNRLRIMPVTRMIG